MEWNTINVLPWGTPRWPNSAEGGDFYLAASGDFLMAVRTPVPLTADDAGPLLSTSHACCKCGSKLSEAVVAYCAKYAKRFGGQMLCYDCQRTRLKSLA
jgi:hypothetical protein